MLLGFLMESHLLQDVFQIDFVVMDENSDAVDNNRAKDYRLKLAGALTEGQILEQQAAAMAAFEEQRLQVTQLQKERKGEGTFQIETSGFGSEPLPMWSRGKVAAAEKLKVSPKVGTGSPRLWQISFRVLAHQSVLLA